MFVEILILLAVVCHLHTIVKVGGGHKRLKGTGLSYTTFNVIPQNLEESADTFILTLLFILLQV